VQPAELPSWAEQQAAALLTGLDDRWSHVQAVAAQARRIGAVLAPEDRPYLIAAAWLHDLGYAPRLNRLGFHPVDGARYVREQGQERLATLVAYHSGARFEAEERGLVDALAEFEPEDGPLRVGAGQLPGCLQDALDPSRRTSPGLAAT
jgi:HD superfamily phosphodiesterase